MTNERAAGYARSLLSIYYAILFLARPAHTLSPFARSALSGLLISERATRLLSSFPLRR